MSSIALPAPSSGVIDWLRSFIRYQGQGGMLPFTPFNGYVDEATPIPPGSPITFYVSEDGQTFYVQES